MNNKMLKNNYRKCVMGCPSGEQLHYFPVNQIRRAEWLRILGIKSSLKSISLCSRHFKDIYKFGKQLTLNAIPMPFVRAGIIEIQNYNSGTHPSFEVSGYFSDSHEEDCINPILTSVDVEENNTERLGILEEENFNSIAHESIEEDYLDDCEEDLDQELMETEDLAEEVIVDNVEEFLEEEFLEEEFLEEEFLEEEFLEEELLEEEFLEEEDLAEKVILDDFVEEGLEKEFIVEGHLMEKHLDHNVEGGDTDNSFLNGSVRGKVYTGRYVQTDPYISSSTPRKLTLKNAVNSYRNKYIEEKRKNHRLKIENSRLSKELHKFKELSSNLESELYKKNDFSSKLSPIMLLCLDNSLKNHCREGKTRRYDLAVKLISLAVNFLSPLTYRYLKPLFDWPSERTLQRFVENWPKSPGNYNGSFEALKLRARDFTEEQKYVTVSCDEMALKVFLDYDRYNEKIIGLEDYGDGNRSNEIATSVVVIMASGIGGDSWSQALSYFFVSGSCKGYVLKRYIFEAISMLKAIGLKPVHFVCDQGTNFLSFKSSIGVSPERPFFNVDGDEVSFFHDAPHLLKSARNCLLNMSRKVYLNGELVSWRNLIYLCRLENPNETKCSYKLSKQHLYPNGFLRMDVSLAYESMSPSVVSSFRTLAASPTMHPSRASSLLNTAKYFELFRMLFDLFNSRTDSTVFTGSPEQLQFLDEAEIALKTIKIIDVEKGDVTKKFHFIKGWLISISALKRLWAHLQQEGFEGLKTRRLDQDYLEHFFGQIRKGSGNAKRITSRNFQCSFQKRWGLLYVNVVVNGNCDPISVDDKVIDFSIVNEAFVSASSDSNWLEFQAPSNPSISNPAPSAKLTPIEANESSLLRSNAFHYVCGYFYLKIFKFHSCEYPLPQFGGEPISEEFLFTFEKQFEKCHLVKPPQGFVEYFNTLEEKFLDLFNENCHAIGIRQIIFNELIKVVPYRCCRNVKDEDVVNLFIRIRIHFVLRFFNIQNKNKDYKEKFLCISHR